MTMRTRLKRREVKARRVLSPAEDRWDDLSEEDWPKLFEAWGQQGHFIGEPDFLMALGGERFRAPFHDRTGDFPPGFLVLAVPPMSEVTRILSAIE